MTHENDRCESATLASREPEVSSQCHANCGESRLMTDKKREEKVNLTFPVLSELVSSSRFVLAPANCDEFGFKATNQEVLDSSTTRGTKWYGEAMRLNTQYTSQDCRTIENKAL